MYKLKAMQCKSALHKLKRNLPYEYDLNLYKGCSHNCIYCYARYTSKFKPEQNAENVIYAKTNVLEHLERELHAFKGARHVINMGGATDAYQEAEKTAKLMRGVLKLMIKYRNPIVISTKSDLVLRDIDLIGELSSLTDVNVAVSLSTVDDDLAGIIEPGASRPTKRLDMIGAIASGTNAMTGVHLFPILPLITDGYEQIDNCYQLSFDKEPDYMLLGTLYLRGETREYYFNKIKEHFPSLYSQTMRLYQNGNLDPEYKNRMYRTINEIKENYTFKMTAEEAIKKLRNGQTLLWKG